MTLPQGWAEASIADIAAINPKHDPDFDRNQPVSFVPMPAVDEHLGTIVGQVDRLLREVWTGFTHFAEGDVIFAKITPCMENGKAAVARGLTNGLACGSTEFYVFRPEQGVRADYLWRFLRQRSFRAEAEQHMSGAVGQRRVPREYLETFGIALPPSAEQCRIVTKLDALTARLARARAELDRAIALAHNQRDAVLNSQLSHWRRPEKLVAFGDQIDVLTSGSRDWARYYDAGASVFVLAGNVRTLRFDPTPKRYVDPPLNSPDARRSKIVNDDLLVTIVGAGTGDICHVPKAPENYFVCQSVARIALREPRLAAFYAYWFASSAHGGAAFREAMYGAARPHLSFDQLKSFRVPDISVEEASEVVAAIASALARADRLEAEAARARALLDRLESAILAKAFRGELVPQDPTDEPASLLLERIRAQRAAAPKTKRGRRAKVEA